MMWAVNAELLNVMVPELRLLLPELDEKGRRLVLGAVARAAGDGGTGAVARLTGASWQTVADGAAELASGGTAGPGRVRRPGGGRKKLADSDPGLAPALRELVDDSARGDPESPLRWTTKSLRHLAEALTGRGHPCSPQVVRLLLKAEGYSLQAPAKVLEGARHPDRDAQFRYIAAQAKEHMGAGQPVVSVDAKKREHVGDYAQPGREWHPQGGPPQVLDHSFPDRDGPGHAIPYGVYDLAANTGLVNVGTDANTGAFAVASLRQWHALIGKGAYPGATRLLVTCDAGSSNGTRNRAWKKELAKFAQDTGLEVTVCHLPPGTSKWNKIEHRLFSQVSHAWRGRPLTSYDVIVNTISAITTTTGLTATAVLDTRPYPAGQEVSDAEIRDIQDRYLTRHEFHGDWNYTVLPSPRPAPAPAPGRAPPPRVPAATLNHPALTGAAPAALLGWAQSLEGTIAALGGPAPGTRRGPEPRLTAADLVIAARIRSHLGLPLRVLAPLLGVTDSGLCQSLKPATRAIAAGTRPPPAAPPPPAPPRSRTALTAYAARHGIDLTTQPPGQAHTAPEATLKAPDTPQTNLISEHSHHRKKSSQVTKSSGHPWPE
jgi:Rhodopirellula transposase DDE domain